MRQLMSQVFCAARAFTDPKLLHPTICVPSFADLEIPAGTRVLLLDKDNTFAAPHDLKVWPPFMAAWLRCREWEAADPEKREVAVLSNTAGYSAKDPHGALAKELEACLSVKVIRHREPKPLCDEEVLAGFRSRGILPEEIVVVGDRLLTDVLLANRMGARSVFLKLNSHPNNLNHLELMLSRLIRG